MSGAIGSGPRWAHALQGTRTLLHKEVLRFWKGGFQTVAAPVLTAAPYLLMAVLQNAFANSSSSLIQSKVTGNLVFLLLSPLSHWAWFVAYVGASMLRALAVGAGVLLVTAWFAPPGLAQPGWILVFALLGAGMLGALGLVAGLWAEKFDQMAAFQNFIIVPMTFLSARGLGRGCGLLVRGFALLALVSAGLPHTGFVGAGDVSPWLSLGVVGSSFVAVSALALHLLKTGYKLRH